jgi:hypothetical protein
MLNRIVAALVAAGMLAGCATPGYERYAEAVARQTAAQSDAAAQNYKAMMAIAQGGDATTKTVALLLLALNGRVMPLPIEPPRDNALAWAQVLVPPLTGLAFGYFNYRQASNANDNLAAITTSGYNALQGTASSGYGALSSVVGSMPQPPDLGSIIGAVQPNYNIGGDGAVGGGTVSKPIITTTTTTTNTNSISGDGAIGGGLTKPAESIQRGLVLSE